MIVQACNHSDYKKHGRNATGKQRFPPPTLRGRPSCAKPSTGSRLLATG
jgi:hypothetical protein